MDRLEPPVILTLSALVVYAVLRYAYQLFYGRLDARPEDVGLSYARILAESGQGLIILLALMAVVVFMYWALGLSLLKQLLELLVLLWIAIRWMIGANGKAAAKAVLVLIIFGLLGWGSYVIYELLPGAVRRVLEAIFPSLLLILMTYGLALTIIERFKAARKSLASLRETKDTSSPSAAPVAEPETEPEVVPADTVAPQTEAESPTAPTEVDARRHTRVGRHAFALASVLLLMAVLFSNAIMDSRHIREGRTVGTHASWFVPIPWSGVRAEVVWTGPNEPKSLRLGESKCLMYLGTADNILVFFDTRTQSGLRLPAASVAVTFTNDPAPCVR